MKKLSKEDLKHSFNYITNNSKGCLFLIATPIGNFDDISLRAIKLLQYVDILLCEDTRKTKKLLSYLCISRKNLISYNDKNAEKKRPYILEELFANKNIGLVSDAGTPLISDPGYKLVKECYLSEIKITHAPGPSSVINGLILSGLPTNQFYFGGFVSSKVEGKKKQFSLTKYSPMTGVWFDTCLRLKSTLKIMLDVYGNRKVSITRELTKIYESVICSDLQSIQNLIDKNQENNITLKGEIVVVIEGCKKNSEINVDILRINIKKKLQKFSLRDTVNLIIKETNYSRKLIYNEAIKLKKSKI